MYVCRRERLQSQAALKSPFAAPGWKRYRRKLQPHLMFQRLGKMAKMRCMHNSEKNFPISNPMCVPALREQSRGSKGL